MKRFNLIIYFLALFTCTYCYASKLNINIIDSNKIFEKSGAHKVTIEFIDDNFNNIRDYSFFSTGIARPITINMMGIELTKRIVHIKISIQTLYSVNSLARHSSEHRKQHPWNYPLTKKYTFTTYHIEKENPMILDLKQATIFLTRNHSYAIFNGQEYKDILLKLHMQKST